MELELLLNLSNKLNCAPNKIKAANKWINWARPGKLKLSIKKPLIIKVNIVLKIITISNGILLKEENIAEILIHK